MRGLDEVGEASPKEAQMANEATKPNDDIMKIKRAYHRVMKRSLAKTPAEFNAAVIARFDKANVPEESRTPKAFLNFAKKVSFPCRRCAGTGQYITKVVNGTPTGPGGICYRCNGKGRQNDADRCRNYGYDNYAFAKAAHAMVGGGGGSNLHGDPEPATDAHGHKCEICEAEEAESHFMGYDMCGSCFAENAHAAQHAKYALDDA
jgi:hypothetical protein